MGYDWFSDAEIAGLYSIQPKDADHIDDATWKDLDVKRFLYVLSKEASLLGRQAIYCRLRCGEADPGRILRCQSDNGEIAARAAPIRITLRCIDQDLTDLFQDNLARLPEWANKLWLMPFLGIAALLVLFSSFWLAGLGLLAGYFIFAIYIQIRFYPVISNWQKQRTALLSVLQCGLKLVQPGKSHPHIFLHELLTFEASIKYTLSQLKPSFFEQIPGVPDYCNMLMLYDYAKYPEQMARLKLNIDQLKKIYTAIADFEAHLCLSEHLNTLDYYCWPVLSNTREIQLTDAINPLLPAGTALSVYSGDQGLLITGQNGSGKSTLLRTIGLNILTARAFGYGYARSAQLPGWPVYSSIQNEDSLSNGVSLYMAELARAAELSRIATQTDKAIFIIDEVFRGTNHLEAIAASAALLTFIAKRCPLFVTTHNLVLAPLLSTYLTPVKVTKDPEPAGGLRLEPGVLAETNGITLMADYPFPDEMIHDSKIIYEWYTDYVIHPALFPKL